MTDLQRQQAVNETSQQLEAMFGGVNANHPPALHFGDQSGVSDSVSSYTEVHEDRAYINIKNFVLYPLIGGASLAFGMSFGPFTLRWRLFLM